MDRHLTPLQKNMAHPTKITHLSDEPIIMCRFMMGESLLLLQPCSALLEDVEEFVGSLGAKHGDACLAKVGNAFEHR